jgi:glycosyltransferase involved in cell wall biosynthesis
MRVLYVVQRYGDGVFGGAEQHCRDFAERMVARGHEVEILTSCALSYVDWKNVFAPGVSTVGDVVVHRFPVAHPRNGPLFSRFNARMMHRRQLVPRSVQLEWMRMQGPFAPDMLRWLDSRSRSYDAVICVTYLYWTAWAALNKCAGVVPTLLHPTAHDEPALQLSLFNELFRLPDAFAFLTPEEQQLVAQRFPGAPDGRVVGVGVELGAEGDGDAFRRQFELGDRPYLCSVGRVDPAKGAAELLDFFIAYKQRNPSDLSLVLVGEPLMDIPERSDIMTTRFVDEATRNNAIAGALALVHPSYFESFSMVLTEAFAQRRPALVQGRCEVMLGHARRSGAALPYSGFAEFEAAVDILLERPELANAMGHAGRAYVEREYSWDLVMDRYEELLEITVSRPRLLASSS